MKLRTTLLTVLALLFVSSMAFAAQPAAAAGQAAQAAVAPTQAAESAEAAPAQAQATCSDAAQSPVLAEPLEEIVPQSHCSGGSGFHVNRCSECPQFTCFCNRINLCCYCE